MKPTMLALLAAAMLAPPCVHAQANTFTDVTVNPQFNAVLAQPGLGAQTNFFAVPAGAADPMNPQGYGLGAFSFIASSPGLAQFQIENDTFIFNGAGPNDPGGNGPVTAPFGVTNDVTLENLALNETFADNFNQTVALPNTSLDTGAVLLASTPFSYDAVNGDPTHGRLTSAKLTGTLDQTSLTIAQPAVVPEPGTPTLLVVGGLLIGALAARRRKQTASA